MRIAMISEAWHPKWGGGQVYALELSKALISNHGCSIDLYTMNLKYRYRHVENHCDGKLHIVRVGKKTTFTIIARLCWIPLAVAAIRHQHKKKPYDVIHAHSNMPALPSKIAGYLLNLPVVYTVHGANYLDLGHKNILYYIEKMLLTKFKYTTQTSVTHSFLKYRNRNHVQVVPGGVNVAAFSPPAMTSPPKPKGRFKIIFVGRFDYMKGIDVLLAALQCIKENLARHQVTVHLIGAGPLRGKLQQQISDLGLTAYVAVRGQLLGTALVYEYQTADLFVLPSRSEGLPLTLLEAWAAQVPVIATDVGDNRNLVIPGLNGYLVDPDNFDALAAAFQRAFDNKHLAQLGVAGYTMVKENYTWAITAKKMFKIYRDVVQHS